MRRTVNDYPIIPAVKAIVAQVLVDPGGHRLCPPITSLDNEQARVLIEKLSKIHFELSPAQTAGVRTG